MNYLLLLKGFLLMCLAWLGIHITHPNGFLYIHITEGSPGYYLVYALCAAVLMVGMHNVYKVMVRFVRCFRAKHYRTIKKRQRDARQSA